MSAELRSAAIFVTAALVVWMVTPLAIRLAVRLRLLDVPAGYKGHTKATPYLGGAAILTGIVIAALAFSGPTPGVWLNHGWAIVACAFVLSIVGTVDDRVNLPVAIRLAVEVGIAVALWKLGHGWLFFRAGGLNLALTIFWVVAIVNAFNLMDNMDGAAATVAGVSTVGVGVLALISGRVLLAPLCFATAGACAGFLPYNLARPARIFMGDGGSLPVGLLVAALTMSVVRSDYLGPAGVLVGGLLVGLVILDTTLVTYSRRRGGRPVLSGGRDHLTHRIVNRLGSPRAVAAVLAGTQLLVCAITIAVAEAGIGWILVAGGVCITFGVVVIWQLEHGAKMGLRQGRTDAPGGAGPTTVTTAHNGTYPQPEPQGERAIA